MTTVSEFVCQGQDVVLFADKVQKQIRVHFIRAGMRKGAASFAVARRHVNPVILKKVYGLRMEFGRKFVISVQHGINRFFPAVMRVMAERQRGVSVPVLNFFNAEPFGFELVKAVRDFGVFFAYRFSQRLNRRVFHILGQIAFGNRVLKPRLVSSVRLVFMTIL